MRFAVLGVAVLAFGISPRAQSQAANGTASFEVASVKPQTELQVGGSSSGTRFYRPSARLRPVIQFAYNLPPFLIVGGPDWIDRDLWAIDARPPARVLVDEMRPMVRQLLADRFNLRAHVETRELHTYDLVLAREDGRLGPNLKPATVNCIPFREGARPREESPVEQSTGFPRCSAGGRIGGGLVTPRLNGVTLPYLAAYLQPVVGRVVVDRTGITEAFDIELTYSDEGLASSSLPPGATRREGATLFTALQEQLGLRLEGSRGPVEAW